VSVNFSPGVVNSSDAQGPFGAMTRDSAGTFYRIRSAYGVYYSETPVGGTPYQVSFTDLDCPAWWDAGPPAGPQCRWTYYEFKPQIALGGPAGQRVTHVAWEKTPWAPYGNRFATKRGTQWTFEDLPQLHTLAADPSGSAWISLNGALYRRTGSSWLQTAVPCGVQVGSFVFDDAGALYLADGSRIWRRDPSGAWGAEATPGEAQVVYVGGGSVHYTSKYSRQPDGGLRPGILYYGRRIGMSWSETAVFFSPPPDYYLEDSQMALDACGAPHFQTTFIARRDYIWALAYVRWTAAGWRQADVVRGFSDPPWAAIGVSTDKAHFIFRNGSATVPLR